MKHLFLFVGMTLFSAFAFSQELRVSNQRTAVADPNQKAIPVPEENAAGTLIIQPVERAMNAAEQSGAEKTEGTNTVNPSEKMVVGSIERTTTSSSGKPISNSTTKKPE